jgi:anti-sigma B factor antagonist
MGSDTEGNPAGNSGPTQHHVSASTSARPFPDADELGGRVVLSISSRRSGSRAVIEIDGELDMQGTAPLKAELQKVLANAVDLVEIDASRVRFVDSAGLTALLAVQADATNAGMGFRVAAASDQFTRVVNLAGLDDVLLPTE